MESETIRCTVCPHECLLAPGNIGRCKTRKNVDGENVSVNYGQVSSLALDPIEKKPLARFYPGSNILSLGSFGCNFSCPFCQNHTISMSDGSNLALTSVSPEIIVDKAKEFIPYGNIGIAFTYNEPLIGYEFVLDTEKLAHENGLKTVVVTNGGINPEIFREVAKNTDAFNIDLKGLNIYESIGGKLETVKENIKTAVEEGSHVEVTTLVIPGVNDTPEEIEEIASFLASISPDIVLHITRFFPQYKMLNVPPTDVNLIYELAEVARKHLPHVYEGNV